MSISNILQDNNFDVEGGLPPGALKNQLLVADPLLPDRAAWQNRSYSSAMISKNNTSLSPSSGVGVWTKVVTGPTTEDINLGGYQLGGLQNEIFATNLLGGGPNIPVHRCLITIVVATDTAPLLDVDFAIRSVNAGIIPTTVTNSLLTQSLSTVVISSRISINPLDTMSLYFKNNTDGTSIGVQQMDWDIEFIGYQP